MTGAWPLGLAIGVLAGALMALLHAFFSISLRSDQIVGGTAINFLALGLTSYLYFKLYGAEGTPTDLSTIPDVRIGFLNDIPVIGNFLDDVFGQLNLMIWLAILLVFVTWVSSSRRRSACASDRSESTHAPRTQSGSASMRSATAR